MAAKRLPDRRIDVQISHITRELDECRPIDRSILEALADRPASTGFISEEIGEQPGYVSQRLGKLVDEGIVLALNQGYYELHPEVVDGER